MLSLSEIAGKLFRLGYSASDVDDMGAGAKRAAIRTSDHAKMQAARVASALPAFAAHRAELAKRRVKRWQAKHGRDLSLAPGHIKRMSREQATR